MLLQAGRDAYGNRENVTVSELSHILDLLDKYMTKPCTIREIRRDDINDPHGRIDIEIAFYDANKMEIHQKLLILDDEVIDGVTFHKRYKEWYS